MGRGPDRPFQLAPRKVKKIVEAVAERAANGSEADQRTLLGLPQVQGLIEPPRTRVPQGILGALISPPESDAESDPVPEAGEER